MIEVHYDEVKGHKIAEYLTAMFNAGWEIVNIQPIKDEDMLVYALVMKRGKYDEPKPKVVINKGDSPNV